MHRGLRIARLSAGAAKRSADAAKKSADALVNAERAWIDVRLSNQGGTMYQFDAVNHGKTPAHILVFRLRRTGHRNTSSDYVETINKLVSRDKPETMYKFALGEELKLAGNVGDINQGLILEGSVGYPVTVQNTGHSPATHVISRATLTREICGIDHLPDNPPQATSVLVPILLLPGASQPSGPASLHLTEADFQSLKSGACGLYHYGTVTYCDIFNHYHYRNFCGRWQIGTPNKFGICDRHNDGDEDYPQKEEEVCPY